MAKKIVQPVEVQASVKGDSSVKSFKAQIREAQQEALRLAAAFGETDARTLAAAKRVAELKDRMDDVNQTIKSLHPDKFQAVANITGTLANGFAAAQGAAALLGGESQDLQKAMLRVQGAMAFSQGIAGLKDIKNQLGGVKALILDSVVPAFTTAAGAAKLLRNALGIGLIITAVTTLIALFNKLDFSIDGVSKTDKKLLDQQKQKLKAAQENVASLDAQDNILKKQGKSETDILKMKIAALKVAIDQQKAVIETSKIQTKAQVEAAKRNRDILKGVLDFLTKPSEWLLTLIDKIAGMLGYDSGLLQELENMKSGLASMVFDPVATQKKADEDLKEMEKGLTEMQNTLAGHELAVQEIQKTAAKEAADKRKEAREKEKADNEKKIKDAEEFQARMKELQDKALQDELKGIKEYYAQRDLEIMKANQDEFDRAFALGENRITQLENELQARKDAGVSTIETETALFNEREKLFKLTSDMLNAEMDKEIKARQDAADKQKEIDAEVAKTKQQAYSDIMTASSALVDLIGQQTVAGKAIALAQIAADTGVAIAKALNTTSSPSPDNVATGGLAGIAKYAAISAAILSASARAVKIVKSGNVQPGGGGAMSMSGGGAMRPSMPSTAAGLPGGSEMAGGAAKVFVTESDISATQGRVKALKAGSVI